MCGICGLVSSPTISDEGPVFRMQKAMVHRGPDGGGNYSDSHISLAMRRLSIIDIDGGKQPLTNEDGSLILIVNGEIYNYIEIRNQLEARGHFFKTKSDSEVILHLYEDYGTACVHYLRGMFAFALWDIKKCQLLLARDRIGEKPLYLMEGSNSLLFASELKILLKSGEIPFIFDPNAINDYFYYAYVPEPKTPIRGVRKLPAGHIWIINANSWSISEECYWRMEDALPITGDPSTLIRKELENISKLIIRSDVPVGVALSGGLDSGAIAALAAKECPDIIHAFTVGYPNRPKCDERRHAKALAEYLNLPYHDIELKTEDVIQSFPQMNFWRDDPISDISGNGYYAVTKLAHEQGVPVLLQGHGGDELFWGYSQEPQATRESIRKHTLITEGCWSAYFRPMLPTSIQPRQLLCWVHSLAGLLPSWRAYKRDINSPPDQLVYEDLSPYFQEADEKVKGLYTSEFYNNVDHNGPFKFFTLPQPWKHIDLHITRLVTQGYLLENGIAQGDRLSMANSVELRLPLVDYRLFELVVGLRKSYPHADFASKIWLKKAVKDLLPHSFLGRPKRGFEPPVKEWCQGIFDAYGSKLSDGVLVQNGVLKRKTALNCVKKSHQHANFMSLSFKALVLEMWCSRMMQSLE